MIKIFLKHFFVLTNLLFTFNISKAPILFQTLYIKLFKIANFIIFVKKLVNVHKVYTKIFRFGVGKKGMEKTILEELYYLNEEIRNKVGKPFDISVTL